ncbi:hypothetical protein M434DRAFT_396137 [Hypoxylon sp. CO27-5]|nr:hypothetical protein M434DRAFT_396137 [Hypoxylon sp. CO27-5]
MSSRESTLWRTMPVAVPSKKTLVLSIAPVLLSAYLIYRFSPLSSQTRPRSRSESSSSSLSKQAGPTWATKRNKSSTDDDEEEDDDADLVSILSDGEDHEQNDLDSEYRRRHEYYCQFRPFFDIRNENADKDEGEQASDEELIKEYDQYIRAGDSIEMKPANEYPDHRWIAMWESWKLFSAWERRASYTNPEFFKMYIHKNFHGLGMQEQIENMLIAFDKEFSKKKRTKKSIKEIWAITAAIMQFLLEIPLDAWLAISDRKKLETTTGLIGRALVSALNELDRAKYLKPDSEVKDVGLIISFYLYWASTLKEEQHIELPFRKEAVAYARKAGIDLSLAGCYGTEERVRALEKEVGRIKPLSGSVKPDRWEWKKKFKKFTKDYNKIGGNKYNILKMSRKERASYALDKKDPLADIPQRAIQEGVIRVRPR